MSPGARILAVYRHPTPYRDPLMDRLARVPGISLHVAYLGSSFAWTPWAREELLHEHSFPRGIHCATLRDMELGVHPGLLARFVRQRPEACVLSGWIDPSVLGLIALCRAFSVPYVLGNETWTRAGHSKAPGWVREPILRGVVQGASAWLPCGSLAKAHVVAAGADPARCHYYPTNSDHERWSRLVDEHRASRPSPREELGLPADGVITFVGRLIDAKAPEITLEAYARLLDRKPEAQLVMVGDGPMRAQLEAHAIAPRVRFLGFRQPAEVARILAATDLFVLASRYEPWGAVVGEALAGGIPALVSDLVGCAPDMVGEHGPGLVVPAEDAEAQAKAMAALLDRPDRRGELATLAKRRALSWGHDLNLRSLLRALGDAGVEPGPEARALAARTATDSGEPLPE